MNPTALIAEDEPLLADALQAELATLWPALRVVARAGDGLQAVEQALALQPQVCFLDIRMPGQSGLDAAQALAEEWPADGAPFPLLVFVTAYDQYAIDAFSAQAVDYLLKPVEPRRLGQCVQRLQQQLAQRQPQAPAAPAVTEAALGQLRGLLAALGATGSAAVPQPAAPRLEVIQASIGQTVHLIPIEDVVYFEAADKYVRVVTADRDYLIRMSLKELLPQLDAQRFWQVHRGTVVQARRVLTAQRDETGKVTLTLRGRPETLTASRLYAALFKAM
jgi:DNA-binding LytR/AlgR family response regulator